MKAIISWAVKNSPAMNVIMVTLLIVGVFCAQRLRREEFPEFELEIILVTVPYPGASPEEVETGICQKIEEAVRSIDGIKKQTTVASESAGSVVLELESEVKDVQKILNEVRSEVDRIPSFPLLAEDPEVKQITMRRAAIKVGIVSSGGDTSTDEKSLAAVAERVRDDLLQLPSVSQAEIQGARAYQIDIEISEDTLRKHGLTLRQVAQIVRRENVEMPGGNMRTDSEDVLLRGKNKRLEGREIEKIPLLTDADGALLTVGDLGVVRDDFADTVAISRINGKPGLVVSVNAAAREDLLKMTSEVREYLKEKELRRGYAFEVWGDRSVNVRDRLNLLVKNGLQGLLLVFVVLAVFLELRLAFWVALGIPISVLGACAVLLLLGETLNMLSMFSFLMALGIVVDDAIVIGENIYEHRQRGKDFRQAAIDGAHEVLPSVTASVSTTIIAFMPMLFVTGVMGKFFAVMPIAVIAMLVISLGESIFILPCHLAHGVSHFSVTATAQLMRRMPGTMRWTLGAVAVAVVWFLLQLVYPLHLLERFTNWVNRQSGSLLDFVATRIYGPGLKFSILNPAVPISSGLALLMFSVGAVRSGVTPWEFFPKLDSNEIEAKITFPNGTPSRVADAATVRMEEAIDQVNNDLSHEGRPVVRLTHRVVGQVGSDQTAAGPGGLQSGGHVGAVRVQLVDTTTRTVTSQEIVDRWRDAAGVFPGADSVTFGANSFGPGGRAIEFKLLADATQMVELEAAAEACKDRLAEYPGVFDIADDARPGKWEYQMKVKDRARTMGVPLAELSETVRAAYYGEEVMRLQRGRHEVKLMVRYPQEERRSLGDFNEIRVRGNDGDERPLTEIAEYDVKRGYAEINRIDQLRSITVMADVDNTRANARVITQDLEKNFLARLQEDNPFIRVRWEGQAEQSSESVASLFKGFGIAILAMYVLLSLEFRSYLQPLIIMLIIPFGAIGAIWGHVYMLLPLTLFSVLGMVALTGVVVNDSIVLIDFINARLAAGAQLNDALMEAGRRRFRPVLLTSVTTIAGLLPILTETSFQAQILIPMATSLCFGLLLATALVLFLVPTFYSIYGRLTLPDSQLDGLISRSASPKAPADLSASSS